MLGLGEYKSAGRKELEIANSRLITAEELVRIAKPTEDDFQRIGDVSFEKPFTPAELIPGNGLGDTKWSPVNNGDLALRTKIFQTRKDLKELLYAHLDLGPVTEAIRLVAELERLAEERGKQSTWAAVDICLSKLITETIKA